jgi:hypothetical protein
MSPSSNYLVYQAYGSLDILNELIFSVASFSNQTNELPASIVVYTDQHEYLRKYLPHSIIYETLSPSKLKAWRGEIDFVHRAKIEMLIDFCQKYSGNVLYVDSDTTFIKSTDILFEAIRGNKLIMHTCEGQITLDSSKPLSRKMARFLNNKTFQVNGQHIAISAEQYMWNAGVLGFNSDKINLLQETLALTDVLYKHYKKHNIEQLAFSFIFSHSGPIMAADDQVFHYWNFKEFRQLLNEYLLEQNTFEKIQATSHGINPIELIKPKLLFERQARWLQQFKKYILKRTWHMPKYKEIKSK